MELVEEVDAAGTPLRVVTRAEVRARRLRHRCVFVLVRDADDRVLVQRRSPCKDLWPDRFDIGAGGVVNAGETFADAARRELAEELGISGVEPRFVGDGAYSDDDVEEMAEIYEVTWNGPVAFADGEVVDARWVTWEELARLLATETFVPDVIALVVPHIIGLDSGIGGQPMMPPDRSSSIW